MDFLLSQGSLVLVFIALIVASFGVPIPEDVVLLASGALAHRHVVSLPAAIVVCVAGVLGGDLLVFTTAKRLGPAAADRAWFRRLLPPKRRARVDAMFAKHGGKVVFLARHVAGLRAPTFALAGMNQMSTARFVLWDSLGLCVTAPLYLGLGYVFSDHLDQVRAGAVRVEHVVVALLVLAVVVYGVVTVVRRQARRRD